MDKSPRSCAPTSKKPPNLVILRGTERYSPSILVSGSLFMRTTAQVRPGANFVPPLLFTRVIYINNNIKVRLILILINYNNIKVSLNYHRFVINIINSSTINNIN